MGLSETILAASIGAAATVSTALFQLFSALRANNRVDTRTKRGSTMKSITAVIALMLVSAVGGFLFSEFRSERTANDMHSMRDDINAKLQVLALTTERLAAMRTNPNETAAPLSSPASSPIHPVLASNSDSVEAVVYAPACQAGSLCTEANSQPLALCGAIPSSMQTRKFELYIKGTSAAEVSKADFDQDLGGAKFSGPPVEYPEGENRKAVCINFLHWSEQPHIATLILQYGAANDVAPSAAQQAASSAAVAATQFSIPSAQITGFSAAP